MAYSLARARVLMARADEGQVDSAAIRDAVDRALAVMEGTKAIKSELTGATNRIGRASGLIEQMETAVRAQLRRDRRAGCRGGVDAAKRQRHRVRERPELRLPRSSPGRIARLAVIAPTPGRGTVPGSGDGVGAGQDGA